MNQSFNNQFHTQRLRESIDETSATPAEGGYLTKPGAKKKSPKPTSGYKEVKGFRPGHSKLKIVEPKDLWNLNEATLSPESSKELNYPNGEKIEVGHKVRIIKSNQIKNGYGTIIGFEHPPSQKSDTEEDSIIVDVDKDKNSTFDRVLPFKKSDIEKMEKDTPEQEKGPLQEGNKTDEILTLIKQLKQSGKLKPEAQQVIMQWMQHPSASEDEIIRVLRLYGGSPNKTSIQEGIKTEIARRNKPQQFQEATRMVNKKLKEINNILEYAQTLQSDLNEGEGVNFSSLMEKVKKGMVSAYAKMKQLENENEELEEKRRRKKNPGLWANIRKQREDGEKPARKGSKEYNKAVAAAKEINKSKE
jgi:hypothetical protein